MGKIKEQPIILLKTFLIFAYFYMYNVFHSLSPVQLFATPWTATCQASLSVTSSRSLLKLMSTETVIPFNCLILCHPLRLPSIFPSIRVFSNESVLRIRWPNCWSFSFSISPSNEYSGLISFRMDWLDLLAIQGTLKNLLQHHSLRASKGKANPVQKRSLWKLLKIQKCELPEQFMPVFPLVFDSRTQHFPPNFHNDV